MRIRLLATFAILAAGLAFAKPAKPALTMVVMDPLAAPLSCPCVKGYAQRDYDKLAKFIEEKIGRPVEVAYAESLPVALKKKTEGKADIVIGKRSVVMAEAKQTPMKFGLVAALTGKEGTTTQTGMIIVLTADPANAVPDLKGYKIIYGPDNCEEKSAAAMMLLKSHGIAIQEKPEIAVACTEGATKLLEIGPAGKTATVISSYAKPLLEGCGTVKKGDLKVVGTTAPVPFIGAFVNEALSTDVKDAIAESLLKVTESPELKKALESKTGFVRPEKKSK